MIYKNGIAKITAKYLLEIKAVKLNAETPFTWASGWKSPIYCDNRKTLSYHEIRDFIRDSFCALISEKFPETEVIAGVATAGIPHGVLIADRLKLPFVYIRSNAKGHGLQNRVEGELPPNAKVVVVEDLVSTGMSSIRAVDVLKNEKANILGMVAIFTYGFDKAYLAFVEKEIQLFTLSDYEHLITQAVEDDFIHQNEMEKLHAWRENPSEWGV
jgi:orotate phosphoribosyltransferase